MCPHFDSSSEDVIQRRRKIERKELSEESYIGDEEDEYGQYDSLFFDIFGTGNEYNYIYDKEEEIEKEEEQEVEFLDEHECREYVKRCVEDVSSKVVDAIFLNEPIEYVAYHLSTHTIKEVLNIQRHVEDYKIYAKLRREEKYKNATQPDTLRAFKLYQPGIKEMYIKGLLSVDKFIENIKVSERINEPFENVTMETDFLYDTHDLNVPYEFKVYTTELSRNSVFVDRIYTFFEENMKKAKSVEKEKIIKMTRDNNLNGFKKFFMSDTDVKGNVVSDRIIEAAFDKVNTNYYNELVNILSKHGQVYTDGGLQDIVNMLISIKGRPGKYTGLYMDKGVVYTVCFNENGIFAEKNSFRISTQKQDLLDYLYNAQNVVMCSNTPSIRSLVDSLQCPCYYLPKIFSLFDAYKEYAIPNNIAQCVQNPVLYFSRAVEEKKNVKLLHCNKGKSIINVDLTILKRALTITAAFDKLDWVHTLNHPYGYTFLKIIGIYLSDKGIDFTAITNLQQLNTDNFTTEEVNKIYTYFKLESSKNVLDRYNLHPKNYTVMYSIAGALASTQNVYGTQDEQLDYFLKNTHLAYNLNFDAAVSTNFIQPLSAMQMIKPRENYFQGASDEMVFYDVVEDLENILDDTKTEQVYYLGTASGLVIDCTDTYAIVDVRGTRIYVSNPPLDVEAQQFVTVKILGPSYHTLNYNGEIDLKPNTEKMFMKHKLFRERVPDNINICLRESKSTPYGCVVVSKVSEGFYFQFLLDEQISNNCVCYKLVKAGSELIFDSIDEFIEMYLNPYNAFLHKISTFKYFKNTAESAETYMGDKGEYRRYCCYFDRKNPGFLIVLFAEFKLNLKIELNFLMYKKKMFGSVEEFSNYCKKTYPNM